MSREEVALRLGCSMATVQKFEREGRITPKRETIGKRERVWFELKDVERLAKEWRPARGQRIRQEDKIATLNMRGKIAAVALPLFEQGVSLAQVVAVTEADPVIIQQLYETWELGYEGRKREREREAQEKRDREEQKRHDRERGRREWMAMRIKIAEIEARARKAG